MNADKFVRGVILIGIPLVLFIIAFEIISQVNGVQAKIRLVDSLQTEVKKIDSLEAEIFILKTEIGRYELGIEYLKEQDSVAASKIENYIYTQTE